MEPLIIGTLELGFIYALMALGVYLSFRVLDFADLTVDGSLPLGAALAASLIIAGYNPWLATGAAILGGVLAGSVTGVLHTHLKITPLLSGILVMTALYSVNLRVMGRSNIPLLREIVIFDYLEMLKIPAKYSSLVFIALAVVLVIFLLYLFLVTDLGLALRATGDNEQMAKSLGININSMKILGLALSNALVALAGAFVAQYQGFADVGMGIGTIIAGLASVIIGEMLIRSDSLFKILLAVVLGSLLYRFVIAVVLRLGLPPTDLKLMTAALVILALAYPGIRIRMHAGI